MPRGIWADSLGIIAATLCAVHCATLTALFLFYPALWLEWSLLAGVCLALAHLWNRRLIRRIRRPFDPS